MADRDQEERKMVGVGRTHDYSVAMGYVLRTCDANANDRDGGGGDGGDFVTGGAGTHLVLAQTMGIVGRSCDFREGERNHQVMATFVSVPFWLFCCRLQPPSPSRPASADPFPCPSMVFSVPLPLLTSSFYSCLLQPRHLRPWER